jgi:methionyl-tRNA formyltransferase
MFQIEPALDSGPIVGRIETSIGETETAGELMLRLADLSVPLTLRVLQQLLEGTAVFEAQDETQVTLAPKIARDAGVIRWSATRREIDCLVRAMQPWPKATAILQRAGQAPLRCIIQQVGSRFDGSVPDCPAEAGVLLEFSGRPVVSAGDGWLEILRIQPEGRKSVDGRAFLNGHPLTEGDRFVMDESRA